MTTTFPTKDAALSHGVSLLRDDKDIQPEELKRLADGSMNQLGYEFPIEIYEVENSKGAIIHLGIEDFRDGFALWLIVPDTPISLRV